MLCVVRSRQKPGAHGVGAVVLRVVAVMSRWCSIFMPSGVMCKRRYKRGVREGER
jgi:hypothetical protein